MSQIEYHEEDHAIRLRREVVIETSKTEIILQLSHLIGNVQEKEMFLLLCRRLEEIIRLDFRSRQDELTSLFSWFDPIDSAQKLDNVPRKNIDDCEKRFLDQLCHMMERSNFQALTEAEWNVATSSQYLLHFPTKIDPKKLDHKMLKERKLNGSPGKDLGTLYAIFRRGIGIDRKSGYFFNAKIDFIFTSMWKSSMLKAWKWFRYQVLNREETEDSSRKASVSSRRESLRTESSRNDPGDKYICVKRIHVSNCFRLKEFFHKLDLQEPTFDHMIIVYRKATTAKNAYCHGDLGIHIKHYKGIPMADMELILPAKKHPRLPLHDWIVLLLFGVVSLVGIISSLRQKNHFGIVAGIMVAFISYCAKVYLTFNMNVLQYERRINKLMEDKQLDCGHASLLYVLDEAIQQEVKESIIAYFELMRGGPATENELRSRCNELIIGHFKNGTSEFQVKDAVEKLKRFAVVEEAADGRLHHVRTDVASEVVHQKMVEHMRAHDHEVVNNGDYLVQFKKLYG